jgi:hypothetical protein
MTQITEPLNGYWNYRVVKSGEMLGIHEVHYSGEGIVQFITAKPIDIVGEDTEEIKWILHHMEANLVLPVIDSKTLKEIE